jgi:lipoate-protein ligase B
MSISYNEAWVPQGAVAVTPSDSTLINCVALYVGGIGNVVIDTVANTNVTFTNVPGGTTLWIKALRVKAASTATNIVALS